MARQAAEADTFSLLITGGKDIVELYHTSMRWGGCATDKGLRPVFGVNGKTTMSNGIAGNSGSGQDWE